MTTPTPEPLWSEVTPPPPIDAALRRRTSGLAVASLVLAILWLLGVGSLLAIGFGVAALASIARSGGTRRGKALAGVGLVVGTLGLVVTAFAYLSMTPGHVVYPVVGPTTVYPTILRLGQTATDPSAASGIRSVSVFAFVYPSIPVDPSITQPVPNAFAIADVQECAGPRGLHKYVGPEGPAVDPTAAGGWEVNFTPGTEGGGGVVGASPVALRQPNFDERMGLRPNQCARGWLTFEVDGMKPIWVTFDSPYAEWSVSS